MPAPATNEELFALIARSGVLEDARVKAYLDKLATAGGVPSDPIKLGGLMVRDGVLTHFQAEQLLQGRWKRFHIGKYKVLERLGIGGMGQVFLCEHKLMRRKVAVKVLPAAKAKDQAALQRFYREARAVAAVDHPNIVRAYDIDDDDQLHFLVMEYVDGANLHDIVKKTGPMPPLRACHYVYASAVGLQHAHENGLVHRDIKPANILVDRSGVVKILDMGLARFFNPDDDDHLTKKFEENVLGTADYLAPEQAMDSTAVDIRADIYGLGGTFYYMLTGQPPFPEGTVAQKLLWHQSKPPKPIADYRKDVPPHLVAIVGRMLAKEPRDRYQTPAELMAALVPWVQTPIDPPTEAELPNVSVAAGGRPPGGSNAPTAVAASRPSPPSAVPNGRAQPVPPQPSMAVLTHAPEAVPQPVPPPPANPWADLYADETIPTAQDTARNRRDRDRDDPPAGRSGRKARTDDDPPAKKKSPLVWILVAAGCGVLLLGGVAAVVTTFVLAAKAKVTSATPPSGERRTWYVSKSGQSPDAAATRGTLAEAVRALKSGDEVVILDDAIETGPIPLTTLRDVRIAPQPGKSVTVNYRPIDARQAAPVFSLKGCENVTLSGLVIDAGGQNDVGIQVSGKANGVSLDRLTVKGAKRFAVGLLTVTADPSQPLTLTGCRFVLPPKGEAGVTVSGAADQECRGVRIQNCRFEGAGAGAGVRVEGAIADVEVKNCRLFQLEAGVLFADLAGPPTVCQVAIERNTIHTAAVGVRIDQKPAAERSVTISRNYFAAVGNAVTAVDPKGVKATNNGRDAATQPGLSAADVVTGATIPPPPADPADAQFLRPTGKLDVKGQTVGAE
jgi:serine/threonine protein kinase